MTISFLTYDEYYHEKIFRKEDWEGNQEFSICMMWSRFVLS